MSAEENKELVRRYWEAVDREPMAAIDAFVAQEYIDHNPPLGSPPGRESLKQTLAVLQAAFPDTKHTVEEIIAEGDRVVTRMTVRATQTGEILGIPPTGRQVTTTGLTIHRVAGGRLVEHWAQFDAFGLLQQLGAIPAAAPAGD